MICRECRTAAGLAQEAEVIYQYLDGRDQELLPGDEAARKMHSRCPEAARQKRLGADAVELAGSAWCDCAHKLPAHPVPGQGQALTLDK